MSNTIHLIIGSTRQNRLGADIAAWVEEQAAKNPTINLQVIDLLAENLPAFDAPVPPAYAPSQTEHGKAWAAKIAKTDRLIFLTPEYNRSMPSSLKNALDYLVDEWKGKPAAIVSYGYIDGGQKAAAHLSDVLGWLKLNLLAGSIHLHIKPDMMTPTGSFADITTAFAEYEKPLHEALRTLIDTQPK